MKEGMGVQRCLHEDNGCKIGAKTDGQFQGTKPKKNSGDEGNTTQRTFSSSNFFSLIFFLFRAVSSLLNASSESVRCFFFEDVEGGSSTSGRKEEISI